MRVFLRAMCGLGLVALGYCLGAQGVLSSPALIAQEEEKLSKETEGKVQEAIESMRAARDALVQDNRYTAATTGLNVFAISVGGVNAMEDLEAGRGVDPETFAALYAGLAVEEVAEHIGKDEQGRLTYKNKVVRMYPLSRLKSLFEKRQEIMGVQPAEPDLF